MGLWELVYGVEVMLVDGLFLLVYFVIVVIGFGLKLESDGFFFNFWIDLLLENRDV